MADILRNETNRTFGRRVRQWRTDQGLTQLQVAERLSAASGRTWHQSMVAKIEAATRPVAYDELFPLAEALGLTVRDLIDDPNPEDWILRDILLAEKRVANLQSERDRVAAQLATLDQELENAETELRQLEYKDLNEQHRGDAL